MPPDHDENRANSLVPVGWMLLVISVLAILALLHHPAAQGANWADLLGSMRKQAGADHIVHGSLSAIFALLCVGMSLFASRLGIWRFPVLAGLISFSFATLLIILAAMTDGFIAPAIASFCNASGGPTCIAGLVDIIRFAGLQIEYLTRFAFVGIAIASLAWAVALLTTPAAPRWSGWLGLAIAVLQFITMLAVQGRLTPYNLLFATAAQFAWYLLVAVLMIRRQPPF